MPARDPFTDMGGPGAAFPTTLWSAVLGARDPEAPDSRERLDRLIRIYWKPVYATLRARWGRSNEEAKDLTQAFFAGFLEKDRLARIGPERGRFRAFLRVVLDNFMRDHAASARAVKRGGGAPVVPIRDEDEIVIPSADLSPEAVFDRAWASQVFQDAVCELERAYEAEGRTESFRAFRAHELSDAPPSCAAIASELGLPAHDVENRLKHARVRFASILRALVRETLLDGEDIDAEIRHLAASLR